MPRVRVRAKFSLLHECAVRASQTTDVIDDREEIPSIAHENRIDVLQLDVLFELTADVIGGPTAIEGKRGLSSEFLHAACQSS